MPDTAVGQGGALSPSACPLQSPGGGAGEETLEALIILHFTLPKIVKRNTFVGHFFSVYCI